MVVRVVVALTHGAAAIVDLARQELVQVLGTESRSGGSQRPFSRSSFCSGRCNPFVLVMSAARARAVESSQRTALEISEASPDASLDMSCRVSIIKANRV